MRTINILLLVLVNCALVLTDETDETDDQRYYDDNVSSLRLFLLNSFQITYTKGHTILKPLVIRRQHGATVLDYHAAKNKIFWISPRAGYWTKNARLYSLGWSHRLDQINSKLRMLREEENWNPRSLAVDYVGDKLYIVDTKERSVSVLDLNGENKTTVFEVESLIPYEVVLDPPKGLMFVLVANAMIGIFQIYRANMDGSELKLIVNKIDELGYFVARDKTGFALDNFRNRIYFGNYVNESIESVDYDGKERLKVVNAENPISINVHNDTLYWSDSKASPKDMFICIDQKCKIMSCKLNTNGACSATTIETFASGASLDFGPHALKPIDPSTQPRIANPCGKNNGGCQHHCLMRSSGNRTLSFGCACKQGWKLMPDLKNCTREKVSRVYVDALVPQAFPFKEIDSDPSSRESFYPISRNLLAQLTYNSPGNLFHEMPFRFFQLNEFGDAVVERSIRDKLKDSMTSDFGRDDILALLGFYFPDFILNLYVEEPNVLRRYRGEKLASALAYDWLTRNLYYAKLTKDDQAELRVLRFEKPDRTVKERESDLEPYIPDFETCLTTISRPIALAVHPYRSLVFALTNNGSVFRLNADGSGKLPLPSIKNATLFTLDLNLDKLYWLDQEGYINYANLNGSDPKRLFSTNHGKIEYIQIFDKWLYIRSDHKIWRFNKLSGNVTAHIDIDDKYFYQESVGIKISSRDAQKPDVEEHPCVEQNGGCDELCFAVAVNGTKALKRVCGCGKDKRILEDGFRCKSIED